MERQGYVSDHMEISQSEAIVVYNQTMKNIIEYYNDRIKEYKY